MNSNTIAPAMLLGIYCVLVLLASLAGGWLLLALRLSHTRLQFVVSFVAGLMLGIGLLHFIPHAFHQVHALDRTVQWVLSGFLMMFFLQRFFPHHHHDVPEGAPEHHHHHTDCHHSEHDGTKTAQRTLAEKSAHQLSWAATTMGMTLHSILGGVALGAAVATESTGHGGIALAGLGTALVIVLHKPFDALAVSTLMTTSGCSRSLRHLFNGLFALMTPIGAGLFYLGASQFTGSNPVLLGGALAFSAGTFLCIACSDLLPELQFHSHDRVKLSFALLLGIAVAVGIGQIEKSGHNHEQLEDSHVELTL